MTIKDDFDLLATQECIQKSLSLISQARKSKTEDQSVKESNIRHSFTSYLRLIFPSTPWWVEDHISRGESNSPYSVGGKSTTGFADNLVGSTAIEYEADLENGVKFEEGFRQVKNYCASLLNKGHDRDQVIGILSDTIRWRAYKILDVTSTDGNLGGEHLQLEQIDSIDLTSGDEVAAQKLLQFLVMHLGRRGSRPLRANTVANDLGLDSMFHQKRAVELQSLIEIASKAKPEYAALIAKLWCSFVTFLRDQGSPDSFDVENYADELYILTLAKLICANLLEKKALLSDDASLTAILDGRYFKSRGLTNLVEYDYFGWLNQEPFVQTLLPTARCIQVDLEAYDFELAQTEDLFGRLMAQLATRAQRLLLGQEWTPSWLASQIVENVFSKLPPDADPQLVDMCCGSGTMIVEAVKLAKGRIEALHPTISVEQKLQKLSQSITGFDIDPLAVILSKINWILASLDWLQNLESGLTVSIPVYHADSLFAITPLSEQIDSEDGSKAHKLRIAEYTVDLPSFLLSPGLQRLFDALLDRSHAIGVTLAQQSKNTLTVNACEAAVESARDESTCSISEDQILELVDFLMELIGVIDTLNREGRNGIWTFVLRNSYRPGLVAGQFNGLVSNPPWLALSKIADNPYKGALRNRAEAFGIKPAGPSHLHIELATIFLLHAVDRYLKQDALIGCVAPETVLNGHHHNPFRKGSYKGAKHPIEFSVDEIWRVQKGTFKNEACVLFGRKTNSIAHNLEQIPGYSATETGLLPKKFLRITRGQREIWSDSGTSWQGKAGFFDPAPFRQGADIMPRTLLFHEVTALPTTGNKPPLWNVKPIDRSTSSLKFVIKDAKEHKAFRISPTTVPDKIVFDVLTSNLLTPFELTDALKALLPIEKSADQRWRPIDPPTLAATPPAKAAIDEILIDYGAGKTIKDLFNALDSARKKLTQQRIPATGYLVVTGAGGKLVCAAQADLASFNNSKLVIDQTLYWATVDTEDEALYLCGLFNSTAINTVIQDFQPRGAFGERHVHKLAFEATPPYDNSQIAHQDVVNQTRALMNEYVALKGVDDELMTLLNPNSSSLASRRRRIRNKIDQLPSYDSYEQACRNLYGV